MGQRGAIIHRIFIRVFARLFVTGYQLQSLVTPSLPYRSTVYARNTST
jgi:hypothetical protein